MHQCIRGCVLVATDYRLKIAFERHPIAAISDTLDTCRACTAPGSQVVLNY